MLNSFRIKDLIWSIMITALVIAFDQYSKFFILDFFSQDPRPYGVNLYLAIALVWNKGVSFGMLHQDAAYMRYILICFTLLLTFGLMIGWYRTKILYVKLALSLVIGGAIGNMIDRFIHGAVVDFIVVHYEQYYWPAFNVADSAISVGVFLIFIHLFFAKDKNELDQLALKK